MRKDSLKSSAKKVYFLSREGEILRGTAPESALKVCSIMATALRQLPKKERYFFVLEGGTYQWQGVPGLRKGWILKHP